MNRRAIGILDSGIGGFTVAKAVQQCLPQEDILYFGDGANAPYGNRSGAELVALAQYMVEFMAEKQVKLLLIACNTISCLAEHYAQHIASPVLYVVHCGAVAVAEENLSKVGVISTQFTQKQGIYAQSIAKLCPQTQVFSAGSTHLVRLIEENRGDIASENAIVAEAQAVLSPLVAEGIGHCVFGCTHYPLALPQIQAAFPNLVFLDPAQTMAQQAKDFLSHNNLLNQGGGKLSVYTTGAVALQGPHLARAGLVAEEVLSYPPFLL